MGYHVTKTTVLTSSRYPVDILPEIHSSNKKSFTSMNNVTFSAMEQSYFPFDKATFVMDRGYTNSKVFFKLNSMEQDYVISLTVRRKLLLYNKYL